MRNPKLLIPLLLGLAAFFTLVLVPGLPDATGPDGSAVALSQEGKAALGLFLLAGIWWVFEVIPVGVTSIAIGVVQALWLIREPRQAFTDFMDPSVWFIFGSLLIGAAFAKTGLTRRLAFLMLTRISERTRIIYLGAFSMTAILTLFMAHTAAAAAIFPLLLTVHHMYEPSGKRTNFGKGLYIGMAYTAGAGSIITLLGAARGAVAIGFYRELAGRDISFFELTYYMLPLGVLMVLFFWAYICVVFPPEKSRLPGLQKQARQLYDQIGPVRWRETATMVIVAGILLALSLRSWLPELARFDKSAVILVAGLLFYILRILELKDLEAIPWNIVLLFGGAMSLGFCLWQTGAAEWLAFGWLNHLKHTNWFVFTLGVTTLVLIMTNFIMNVAAIAVTLPVALIMAPHVGVHPEVIMFASLAAAGMPLVLLVGAAPNAIAFESRQFRTREFFQAGLPASLILIGVIGFFAWKVWPWMGMPTGH